MWLLTPICLYGKYLLGKGAIHMYWPGLCYVYCVFLHIWHSKRNCSSSTLVPHDSEVYDKEVYLYSADNECLIFFKAWMIDEVDSENYWKLTYQKWQMVSNCLLPVTFPHMCLCLAVTLIKSCCPAWDTAGPGDVSVSDHHYRYMSSVVVGLTAQWK